MSDQTCGLCKYPASDGQSGLLCRRYPPHPVVVKAENVGQQTGVTTTSVFPPVPQNGWCGEWKPAQPGTVTVLQPMSVVQFPQRDPGDENPER